MHNRNSRPNWRGKDAINKNAGTSENMIWRVKQPDLPKLMASLNLGPLPLPQDITLDILSRLPVKSVMRCRCVCKAWRTLLTNPHFINTHFKRSSQDKPRNLLFATMSYSTFEKDGHPGLRVHYKIHFVEHLLQLGQIDQPISPMEHLKNYLVASCNGLLCLLDYHESLVIQNPFLRETVELSKSKTKYKFNKGMFHFGYHSKTNEYKVLWLVPKTDYKVLALVYTLGSSSWRSKGELACSLFWKLNNVLVNGALHTLGYYRHLGSRNAVINSFDLEDEEFRFLPIPPKSGLDDKWGSKLLYQFGESLSFVDYASNYGIDIWVMKDYGIEESWNKQFVVTVPVPVESVSLIWPLEGGEILLHYNESFIFYNPNDGQIRRAEAEVPSDIYRCFLISPRLTA